MLAIIKKAGKIMGDGKIPNFTALASAIGCSRSSLYTWKSVPETYRKKIARATNGKITVQQLERAR